MDLFSYSFCESDAAAFDYDVDVLARASEETVADVSADDECTHTQLACRFGDDGEYLMVKKTLCYCC